MTNIFNTTIWNLSGVSGYPGPLDGGEVGDGTGFYQLGLYCRFLLAGILNGDLAAVPSHGAEEDVTLMHMKGARSKVPHSGHFR